MISNNMYINIIDIIGWYISWKLIDRLVEKYELNKNKKYYVNILLLVLFIVYLIIKHNILA